MQDLHGASDTVGVTFSGQMPNTFAAGVVVVGEYAAARGVIALGRLALSLALVFVLAGILFLAFGVLWQRKDLLRNGY
jgi:hypothetical protein